MALPTSAQVNAAARNAGSFAAGAIAMFGLGSKINPDTVTAIINATSTLVNDLLVLIGLVSPFLTAYFASKSASPKAQIAAVAANPEVQAVVTTPAVANSPEFVANDKVVTKTGA